MRFAFEPFRGLTHVLGSVAQRYRASECEGLRCDSSCFTVRLCQDEQIYFSVYFFHVRYLQTMNLGRERNVSPVCSLMPNMTGLSQVNDTIARLVR